MDKPHIQIYKGLNLMEAVFISIVWKSPLLSSGRWENSPKFFEFFKLGDTWKCWMSATFQNYTFNQHAL